MPVDHGLARRAGKLRVSAAKAQAPGHHLIKHRSASNVLPHEQLEIPYESDC